MGLRCLERKKFDLIGGAKRRNILDQVNLVAGLRVRERTPRDLMTCVLQFHFLSEAAYQGCLTVVSRPPLHVLTLVTGDFE